MEEGLWVGRFYVEFGVQDGVPPEPVAFVDFQVQEGDGLL